jgi:hypothetical protein
LAEEGLPFVKGRAPVGIHVDLRLVALAIPPTNAEAAQAAAPGQGKGNQHQRKLEGVVHLCSHRPGAVSISLSLSSFETT